MKNITFEILVFFSLTASVFAKENLVFSCDFSDGYKPQVAVQPCLQDASDVQIIDVADGKALRIGKKTGDKAGRLIFPLTGQVKPQSLANNLQPFPLRFGKLQFQFRPVGWALKDVGFNMFLRMEGPLGTLLHVVYICPKGVPSVQVAYGQQKNPNVSKGELPVIYPYMKLDTSREWHDVEIAWQPTEVSLTVDGENLVTPTTNLAYPETDFYATRLCVGYSLANLSLGETDIRDLKIWATEPEAVQVEQPKNRFPLITANPISAPAIDGEIADAEWKRASSFTGFLKLPKGSVTEYQPEVKVGYDKENLYFAIKSKGHMRQPIQAETKRDGSVWKDDSLELYFASESDKGNYYQIVVNHNGTVFDQHCQSGKPQAECFAWNCNGFRSASKISGDNWCTEIAVPFASLAMSSPKKGDCMLFNLCESVIGAGFYSLAAVKTKFAEYGNFGIIEFGDADSSVVSFSDLGDLFRGEAAFRCGADGNLPVQMEISAKRYDQTADTEFALFSETVQVPKTPKVCFKGDSGRLKKNGIIYASLIQDGKYIYSGRFFYEATMKAEVETMRRTVIDGKNHLRIVTAVMNDGKSRLRLTACDSQGNKAAETVVPITATKQTSYLDISGLPTGNYTLVGELMDAGGNVYQKTEGREFTVYDKTPPWHDFVKKNIKTDHVPAPWTPLAIRNVNGKIHVSCWNREYIFGKESLFAEQITTAGIPLLKSPVMLSLKKDGALGILSKSIQKVKSSSDRRVVIESSCEISDGGSITVSAEIDYDGFIWYEMALNVKKGSSIEQLYVQLDIPKEHSTLMNSGFRDLENTGATPDYWGKTLEGISGPFWIGMEKGGLSFGIESTEYWSNKNVSAQAEVFRKATETNVRLNIVDTPLAISKAPVYGFYIHPTPVRPRPEGYRKLRAQNWFAYNRTAAQKETYYPANFSWWMTTFYRQGTPYWAVDAKEIEEVSRSRQDDYKKNKSIYHYDALDKSKTRSAWYAAYSSIGRNSPEVIWNGDDWFAGEQERLYGNTLYGYEMDMIEVCKTADYCDFYLWKFAQAHNGKPAVDGIYFDLWGAPACTREDHGHGYLAANGVRRPVYPLREHRRWMELVYIYCKEMANDAPIVCHVSGATAHIAGYSHADYLLDGELWFHQLAKDKSYKSLSLDTARAEILPQIWGPGVIWLSELHRAKGYAPPSQQKTWAEEPWARRHFSGILMLHDGLPDRTSLFETARQIWVALDRFQLSDHDEFLPYWKNCGITGDNDGKDTAITAYLKKAERRMMLVVFNNHDHPLNSQIVLDMKQIFNVDGTADVYDLETDTKLFSGVTKFAVLVEQRNFRLLQIVVNK